MNSNRKTKPREQHHIPRVYLKQFEIDQGANKSFVYCRDFSNPYNTKVQRIGLNDRMFKLRNFYNDRRLFDPFIIERLLSTDVEPTYEGIMNTIKREEPLSVSIREDIMSWLFFTQQRSPFLRKNTKDIIRFVIDTTTQYHKRHLNGEEKQLVEKYIDQSAREIQLNGFCSSEDTDKMLMTYIETLNAKHWKILKSPQNLQFLTNDNPGFSPNLHPKFAAYRPFHPVMELNHSSIIYFVFSPQYCLEIRPFFDGTPLDICAMNMDIKYEQVAPDYIGLINEGVFYTKYKLVITNVRTML
jgi:Protein of unknown function (DUF4238)